jgi:Holliday junction resolvase RusA-like endonuclease
MAGKQKANGTRSRSKGEIAIEATFFYSTRRKFDLGNANKLWADTLSGIVYEDDNQIASLRLVRSYDKKRPRIELSVHRYDG